MPEIRQLDKHISELIAAGEVVERPASVVKELLENAIDAGSSAVVVELEHGGLTYLRISDNGCGIAPEQLPVAFLRHATSKLRTAEDLAAIGTLGFRGEALAAISAVSRVDIFSRQRGAETGAMLHLDGGVPGIVQETGCPEGTTICVRELFYNTPARMKFMKKDSAEATAVAGIVAHLALSHPHISCKLLRDGQEVLHTPGDGQVKSAVYAAMGRDFAKELLPVRGCGGNVRVEGFVTAPLAVQGTRGKQVFFVNGRFVKSQLLTAALEEAYRNRLLKGKFPGCVLYITLPNGDVDVNVHPAKTVVKFVSDKSVFDAVYYTVKDALDGQSAPVSGVEKPAFYRTMTAQEYRDTAPAVAVREKKPLGSFTVRTVTEPVRQAPVSASKPETMRLCDVAPERDEAFTAPAANGGSYVITPPEKGDAEEKHTETAAVSDAPKAEENEQTALPMEEQQSMEPVTEAPWRVVGEVLKTYIVCEDAHQTVWLIDKHAAHERIRFDALKERGEPMMEQTLLTPVTVELEAEEYDAVLENLPLLREFAMTCEDFGDGTVLLRTIPADIRAEDAAATLAELAHKLTLGHADPAAARDELLHTMACKSAIKAGMTTDPSELAVLVEAVQAGTIRFCPHGRPVKYQLTKYEIEKMFKRA